ncbi:MAG: T9SS type A sorting domain-containing protein [Bacteroidetes bacterium]|nr:T9SS type A sorting domain-containing protein [Bacteroidota bacterium]
MKKHLFFLGVSIFVSLAAVAQWAPVNYNQNMEVYSLHFINDTVGYAAGYHEVYKTADGGQNWAEIENSVFTNGPSGVWFITENVGFIIGSDGGGNPQVGKTINGGASWTKTSLPVGSMGFNDANKLFFFDQNTGYIVCRSGHIYKTTDQGVAWNELTSGTTDDLTSIYFPTPTAGYASLMNSGSLLKTINGGNSWSLVSLGQTVGVNDLYFTSADTGFLACSGSKILKTTDGGLNWSVFTFGTNDVFYAIEFTSDNMGYVAGSTGTIATTTNAGSTWVGGSGGITNLLYCMDFPSPQGYIGALGPPGKIIKSINGGGILSVAELNESNSISVFPNPASDIFSLNVTRDIKSDLILDIYNLMGTLVKTEIIKQNQQQINVGDLSNGIYLVEVKSKGFTANKKLIIQR